MGDTMTVYLSFEKCAQQLGAQEFPRIQRRHQLSTGHGAEPGEPGLIREELTCEIQVFGPRR